MHPLASLERDESLACFVHDLRQPLGTIEYSACYLQMILGDAPPAVQEQLRLILDQVERAARLLSEACTPAPRSAQCLAEESLDLTNSQTAGVTYAGG